MHMCIWCDGMRGTKLKSFLINFKSRCFCTGSYLYSLSFGEKGSQSLAISQKLPTDEEFFSSLSKSYKSLWPSSSLFGKWERTISRAFEVLKQIEHS